MSRAFMVNRVHRIGLRCAILLIAALWSAPAAARKVVLADVYGELDVRPESSALTDLLTSALTDAGLEVVPRHQLDQVLTSLLGSKSSYALVVRGTEARRVLHSLASDILINGTLTREGTRLTASMVIFVLGHEEAIQLSRTAPHGQVAKLAEKISVGIGKKLNLKVGKTPAASMGQLHAFARAGSAALAGDAKATVMALRAGDPNVAKDLPGVLAAGKALAEKKEIPLDTRLDAALFSGNFALAERMANKELETKPRDELALATKAFVKLQRGETEEAEELLAKAGARRRGSLTLLTRAAADHQAGRKNARDNILRKLVKKGYMPALRLVATMEPGDLAPRLEQEVLRMAQKNVGQWPGLATSLGLRAAQGNIKAEAALDLVRVGLLTSQQLKLLDPLLKQAIQSGWPVGFRLRGELYLIHGKMAKADDAMVRAVHADAKDGHAQRLRGYILMEQGDLRAASRAFEAATTTQKGPGGETRWEYLRTLNLLGDVEGAKKVEKQLAQKMDLKGLKSSKLDLKNEEKGWSKEPSQALTSENKASRLVDEFRPVVGAFTVLAGKAGMTVAMAPLEESWWHELWPAQVHPDRAGEAMRKVLSAPPYLLQVSDTALVPQSDITATRLDVISNNAGTDGLLLFLLSPHLLSVKVRLVYYHVIAGEAYEYETTLDREAAYALGLISLKPIYVRVALATLCLMILIVLFRTVRGLGGVKVRIQRDPAAKNPAYTLRLSRSSKLPSVGDPVSYERALLNSGGKLSRLVATMPGPSTEFEDVPTGTWFVHIYGTHKKGGKLETLTGDLTQQIQLGRGKTALVSFDLEPNFAGLQVRIYDGGKVVRDAEIWLDDKTADKIFTDKTGRATLQIPRRVSCTLHVEAGDMTVMRAIEFDDTSVHHLTINLARERKVDEVDLSEESEPRMEDLLEPTSQAEDPPREELADPTPMTAEADGIQLVSLDDRKDKVEMGIDYSAVFGDKPSDQATAPKASTRAGRAPAGLGRYELMQELGRGGMGVVHKARDRVLEREVALKIIGAELKDHPEARKLFLSEAKAMAALNHPNLVMIFDQGWDGDQTFVVMEYVEGKTLEQIITSDGGAGVGLGLDYFDQICCGLAFAHSRDIIHRDIKPDNIFISSEGVVKVGDFGLAKVARGMEIKRTQVRGTPMYMAPEQIRGKDIDHRADIYSLGCTAFAMFCGRPPFTEGEVLYHHIHTAPPKPTDLVPHLPPELDRVLLDCLAKPKAKRIGSVEELRRVIKPLLARLG